MPEGIDNNNNTPIGGSENALSRQWIPALMRGGLVLSVIGSALGVAYLSQQNRHLFTQVEGLRREESALDARWSRLLLERGTLTSQSQLEKRAGELSMYRPQPAEVVVVR
jgi:cell division protein FtsL